MELNIIQRSAFELVLGSGENELRVLFSMSMPVGLLFQGTYAVLDTSDRRFRTSNLHLSTWMKKRTLETAQAFKLEDLEAMIGRLMVRVCSQPQQTPSIPVVASADVPVDKVVVVVP